MIDVVGATFDRVNAICSMVLFRATDPPVVVPFRALTSVTEAALCGPGP